MHASSRKRTNGHGGRPPQVEQEINIPLISKHGKCVAFRVHTSFYGFVLALWLFAEDVYMIFSVSFDFDGG